MAVLVNILSSRGLSTILRYVLAVPCRKHTSLTNLIENMDKRETWDRFYRERRDVSNFKNFEWFFGFDSIRDFIMPLLTPQPNSDRLRRILDMGCGTSALGPTIYRNSQWPVHVTCGDISPVAVHLLQEQSKSKPVEAGNPASKLDFLELDCCQLQAWFGLESLDMIIDKGTTDALLRSKEGQSKAGQALKQCLGVLPQTGFLLQFSDEDPDARLLWLERESGCLGVGAAKIGVHEVGTLRGVCYYCYVISPSSTAH
ncbi:hypothetical protein JZ751_006993 [Albula glossodonta]|uniref:Citrate synthase-lysine N-methyltransferase CSKMT, mitochondrial n=1 Tax=Albula glossodonta TaxID=121402 RepID=A0A8T2P5Y2_9TELE|nr:hypothetical protein JZ751_006993 [Albula glossodonta]